MVITYDMIYWILIWLWVYVMSQVSESVTVYPEIVSSVGERVQLPCNVSSPSPDDAITLVLWYKSDIKILPIYTVDIRHNRDRAKHLTSDVFDDRANFNLSVRPAIFTIDPVHENDGGEYRCRVDFRWGRTLNSVVNLNVIVPPKKVIIKDEKDQQVSGLIGPVEEGSAVRLTCIAKGGKPQPSLHWYRDNVLIDVSTSIHDDSTVRNELLITNLKRSDLNVLFTCHAVNNNSTPPLSTSVSFDIFVRPIDVQIISIKRPLSQGKKFDLICRSRGSRPPAQLSWIKNNRPLTRTRETFSEDGNVTTSVLEFSPTAEDNGAHLICRADNLRLANSSIRDEWSLNIFFEPKVSLSLRVTSKKGLVAVGTEVFLECQIIANPIVVEVSWLFNGKPLQSDTDKALFIRNASVEIRSVRREHHGRYQCTSSNLEGTGKSNELQLDVHYAPICKENQLNNTIGAAFGETVKLQCDVDASPSDVTFYWTFNDMRDNELNFVNDGLRSVLTYIPNSKDDFGTVACWTQNIVGSQKEACIFKLIAAGPPEAVHECIIRNQTVSSFMVECASGYDGGLQQSFHLEVYDGDGKRLISNVTNKESAEFFISDLKSGSAFILNIYSANLKGNSANVSVTGTTLSLSSSTSETDEALQMLFDLSPVIGIIIGFITAVILVTVIIVLICKINRKNRYEEKHASGGKSRDRSQHKLANKDNEFSDSHDTKSPDIIPPCVEFPEYPQCSIQRIDSNWDSYNNVNINYANGIIPNSVPNKKIRFDNDTISHTLDDSVSQISGSNANLYQKKYSDYAYKTLPHTFSEHEPVINYGTIIRNDPTKHPFRALSTPV